MSEEIEINGLPVQVVSEEEAEKAGLVLCIRKADQDPIIAAMFADNLEGPCAVCGETVVFRPHSPKSPPRVCFQCLMAELEDA